MSTSTQAMDDPASNRKTESNAREIARQIRLEEAELEWQRQMLPTMRRMVVGLTVFFLVASAIQLTYLHVQIKGTPSAELSTALDFLEPATDESGKALLSQQEKNASAMIGTMAILEANAVARRYHQANVSLMSRVWVRYLAFVTGVVMAMVGAVFVLGKIRGPTSSVEGKTADWSFALKSSYPGLILAGMGTILIMTAMIVHHPINVKDQPLYTVGWGLGAPPQQTSRGTTPSPDIPKGLGGQSAPVPDFLSKKPQKGPFGGGPRDSSPTTGGNAK